jgi:hypothetical protein
LHHYIPGETAVETIAVAMVCDDNDLVIDTPRTGKVTDAPKGCLLRLANIRPKLWRKNRRQTRADVRRPPSTIAFSLPRPMLLMDPAAEAAIGRGKVVVAVDEARTERFATRSE